MSSCHPGKCLGLPTWRVAFLGAMLDISVPGHGGGQQAIVYSIKEYTSARDSWRKDRVGKPPPPASRRRRNHRPTRGGGGLTSESLQQHAEDLSSLGWTKVVAERRRAEPALSGVPPLMMLQQWTVQCTCFPILRWQRAMWRVRTPWWTRAGPPLRDALPRYTFAFKMFRRHHLSVVRVQDHHLHTDAGLSGAEYQAGLHGYTFVGLPSPELKSRVCLLYKLEWEFVSSTPLSSRILCDVLKHPDGFSVACVLGHFYNDAVQRMRQWQELQGHERRLGGVPMVFLADNNSILSHLDSMRENIWSLHELSAMESERDCLQAFAVHDAWAHQFPDRDPPGYTRTSVLRRAADGTHIVSRRIDSISVSHSLFGYASSMFTTLVGFSDHNSVVLQFVGMGLDGEQPNRWRFPRDALQDSDTLDSLSRELQTLKEEGV